jgi:uncharacterized protein YyaL (SSP411 family)
MLAGWNGLMIDSMAVAAGALDDPRYLAAATAAADFVLTQMQRKDGRLLHSWRNGQAKFDAYLDDYANVINACVSLYEAGFEERFIDEAVRLSDIVLAHFADTAHGGFFYTADDHQQLIARQKDVQDNPLPSGNAMAANALLRLGKLTGRGDYLQAAEGVLNAFSMYLARIPTATGQLLLALDLYLGPTYELVLIGSGRPAETTELLNALRHRYAPRKMLACRAASAGGGSSALGGLFEGKTVVNKQPTLYICQNFTCQQPVRGKEAILKAWEEVTLSAVGKPNA